MIEPGSEIFLEYTLSTEDEVLDTTEGVRPLKIVLGASHIHPSLEKALAPLEEGSTFSLSLDPSLAFGEIDPKLEITMHESKIPAEIRGLELGQAFEMMAHDKKKRLFRIVKKADEKITIDANHPFAGRTVHWEGKIIKVTRPQASLTP